MCHRFENDFVNAFWLGQAENSFGGEKKKVSGKIMLPGGKMLRDKKEKFRAWSATNLPLSSVFG